MSGKLSDAEPALPASGSRKSILWVQGLACGALLTFAAPTMLLIAVLFAPAAICLLAEPGPGRGLARAVALACGAASLAPLWHLWLAGGGMDQAIAALSDPRHVLLAWGAGASAWASCQVLPVILRSAWDLREAARARAMEAELGMYRETWDFEGK